MPEPLRFYSTDQTDIGRAKALVRFLRAVERLEAQWVDKNVIERACAQAEKEPKKAYEAEKCRVSAEFSRLFRRPEEGALLEYHGEDIELVRELIPLLKEQGLKRGVDYTITGPRSKEL